MARGDHAAMIALLRQRPGRVTVSQLRDAVLEAGSAEAVWHELVPDTLFAGDDPLADADAALMSWSRSGITVLSILDEQYPERVRAIREAPPVLFARGALRPSEVAVSVVGSRTASPAGLGFASTLARALAREHVTVVSGLARGIDTAAHTAALAVGGRTVAMIGTGLDRFYPPENKPLQQRIASEGAVYSQFFPDASPHRGSFLMRNAVMSGFGTATVVVEAGEHSGARAQTRNAVEHGRPVILTEHVAHATEWGRSVRDQRSVHVVGTVDEAMTCLRGLWEAERALAGAVAAFSGR